MDNNTMLEMLKVDLGISTTAYDERLIQYIETAKTAIAEEGITLDLEVIRDCTLVIMFAGWLWSKRDTGAAMPRMLRYELNNRLFTEKTEA